MTEQQAPYYLVKPTPKNDIDFVLKTYVCSACLGDLFAEYCNERWFVICRNCKYETREYISRPE